MALFDTLRLATFVSVLGCSLIVLGITGHWVSLLAGFGSTLSTSASFALAIAVITWAFMLPVFLIGILRRGSFLSWVAVELGICGLMWVFWLASAAYTSSMTGGVSLNCDYRFLTVEEESICRQYQAVQAFSWLVWLILMAYIVLLLVFAVKAMHAGHSSVWTSEITDLSSFTAGGGAPAHKNSAYTPSMANTNNTGHPSMVPTPHPQQYQQSGYNPNAVQV